MVITKSATTLPSDADARLAKEMGGVLEGILTSAQPLRLRTIDGPTEHTLTLPAPAAILLARILNEMAQGNAVAITPVHAELTTQEAADMLNISRPTLIQLLGQGQIAFRTVGSHRRVRFDSLLQYKRRADADRLAALEELVAYDQELGL